MISLVDWTLLESFEDPNVAMSIFHEVLFDIFEFCFPHVTVRFSDRDPPWMSVPLKILLNRRDRAFNQGKTQLFKRLRSQVAGLIAQLKKRYLLKMERCSSERDAFEQSLDCR